MADLKTQIKGKKPGGVTGSLRMGESGYDDETGEIQAPSEICHSWTVTFFKSGYREASLPTHWVCT